MTSEELILEAKKAREQAYTPYSHFQVGAVKYITAAISKMPPTPRLTVQSGQHFSRQSMRASGNLSGLPSSEARKVPRRTHYALPVASAARS